MNQDSREIEEINMGEENNSIELKGKFAKDLEVSHELMGETFYKTSIQVLRLSGDIDELNLVISERELIDKEFKKGSLVRVLGQVRAYNYFTDNGNIRKVIINVFVKEITELSEEEYAENKDTNIVELEGYICKEPVYRKTPFGREIADLLIAVNRKYGKTDYLPCIAWGRNARFSRNLEVGDLIKINGRMQSRNYTKKYENGDSKEKVAYEISIITLELPEENAEENSEEVLEQKEA